MRISVEGGKVVVVMELSDATTTYFAIREYLDKVRTDLSTHYDNSPRWCEEDEEFLSGLRDHLAELAAVYEAANEEISSSAYKFI